MKQKKYETKALWNFGKIKPGEVFINPSTGDVYIKTESTYDVIARFMCNAVKLETGELDEFSDLNKVVRYNNAEFILNKPCEFKED